MGIYLMLDILPDAIDPTAWAAVYDETLAFLTGCPEGLLRLHEKKVGRCRRVYLSRALERPRTGKSRNWAVDGAFVDHSFTETFTVVRDLDHYRRSDFGRPEPTPVRTDDILNGTLDNSFPGSRTVFGEKTQGGAAHIPLLGAAMMIETAFPQAAVLGGDIDATQARMAQALVASVTGRSPALPVRVDAPALLRRLSLTRDPTETMETFSDLYCGAEDDGLRGLAEAFGENQVASWFAGHLKASRLEVNQLGVQWLLSRWLNAGLPVDRLIDLACVADNGPHYDPVALARALAATWLTAPADDVECIQRMLPSAREPASSVDEQFASVFLDLSGASGRRCRVRIGEEELVALFAGRFPDQADAIAEALSQRTSESRQVVDKLSEALRDMAGSDGDLQRPRRQAPTDLATVASAEELCPQESEMMAGMARTMGERWDDVWKAAGLDPQAPDPAVYQEATSALAEQHGVLLSEDAWGRIDAERVPVGMFVPLYLLLLASDTKAVADFRHAVLENGVICRYLAGLVAATREQT